MKETLRTRTRLRRGLIVAFLIVLAATLSLLAVEHPPTWLAVALVGVALLLGVTVARHARRTIYVCTACRHTFKISSWNDFVSPHLPDRKLLTCPKCRHSDWFHTLGATVKTLETEDQPA